MRTHATAILCLLTALAGPTFALADDADPLDGTSSPPVAADSTILDEFGPADPGNSKFEYGGTRAVEVQPEPSEEAAPIPKGMRVISIDAMEKWTSNAQRRIAAGDEVALYAIEESGFPARVHDEAVTIHAVKSSGSGSPPRDIRTYFLLLTPAQVTAINYRKPFAKSWLVEAAADRGVVSQRGYALKHGDAGGIAKSLAAIDPRIDVEILDPDKFIGTDHDVNAILVSGDAPTHRWVAALLRALDRADGGSADEPEAAAVEPGANVPAVPLEATKPAPPIRLRVAVDEGGTRIVDLPETATRIEHPDPKVEVQILNGESLLLRGRKPGVGKVAALLENGRRVEIDVDVSADTRELDALLAKLYPTAKLDLHLVRDAILVRGAVQAREHVDQIVEIAGQFYPRVLNQLTIAPRPTNDDAAEHERSGSLGRPATNLAGTGSSLGRASRASSKSGDDSPSADMAAQGQSELRAAREAVTQATIDLGRVVRAPTSSRAVEAARERVEAAKANARAAEYAMTMRAAAAAMTGDSSMSSLDARAAQQSVVDELRSLRGEVQALRADVQRVLEALEARDESAAATDGEFAGKLLYFTATWCGPCKQVDPIVRRMEEEGLPVQQVDVDRERALAQKYGVTSIPAFVLVMNGQVVDRKVGVTAERTLRSMAARISRDGVSSTAGGENAESLVRQELAMGLEAVDPTNLPEKSRYRGAVRVTGTVLGGRAASAGMKQGDLLVGLDAWETTSLVDVAFVLRRLRQQNERQVKFYVLRKGRDGWETLHGQLPLAAATGNQVVTKPLAEPRSLDVIVSNPIVRELPGHVRLLVGEHRMVALARPADNVNVGDATIVGLDAQTDKYVEIHGVRPGRTTLNLNRKGELVPETIQITVEREPFPQDSLDPTVPGISVDANPLVSPVEPR